MATSLRFLHRPSVRRLGAIAFKEHIRQDRWTVAAVAIAAAGVGYAYDNAGLRSMDFAPFWPRASRLRDSEEKAALNSIHPYRRRDHRREPVRSGFPQDAPRGASPYSAGRTAAPTADARAGRHRSTVPLITFAFTTDRNRSSAWGSSNTSRRRPARLGLFVITGSASMERCGSPSRPS